jgi:hypothetical protein
MDCLHNDFDFICWTNPKNAGKIPKNIKKIPNMAEFAGIPKKG